MQAAVGAAKLIRAMESSAARGGVPHVAVVAPSCCAIHSDPESHLRTVRLETAIAEAVSSMNNCHCLRLGDREWADGPSLQVQAHSPWAPQGFATLAWEVNGRFVHAW